MTYDQNEAITHPPDGPPLLVLGPAGSGKTTLLLERARFLVKGGVQARAILILSPRSSGLKDLMTNLRLAVEVDAGGLTSIDSVFPASDDSTNLPHVATIWSFAREILNESTREQVRTGDESTVVTKAIAHLKSHPEALLEQQARYAHIMIDDLEDASEEEYELAALLAKRHRKLSAYGDDLRFPSGAPPGMACFARDHPPVRRIVLPCGARFAGAIRDLSIAIRESLGETRTGSAATSSGAGTIRVVSVPDAFSEARFVAEEIADAGADGGRTAVLARTHEYLVETMISLEEKGSDYVKEGAVETLATPEVRATIAMVALISAARDTGKGSWRKALEVVVQRELLDALTHPSLGLLEREIESSPRAIDSRWALCEEQPPPGLSIDLLRATRRIKEYVNSFASETPTADAVLERAFAFFPIVHPANPSTSAALARRWLTAVAEGLTRDEESTSRSLSAFPIAARKRIEGDGRGTRFEGAMLATMHGARGREFNRVYLVGAIDGLVPLTGGHEETRARTESETRLFYQAVTRAKLDLTILVPRTLVRGTTSWDTRPSRYLKYFEKVPVKRLRF